MRRGSRLEMAGVALAELEGELCLGCGGGKQPRKSVCASCWARLPHELRQRLYQRVGDGYEKAYAEALELLTGGRRAQAGPV